MKAKLSIGGVDIISMDLEQVYKETPSFEVNTAINGMTDAALEVVHETIDELSRGFVEWMRQAGRGL